MFRKATNEVKQFVKPSFYEHRSKEVKGILYYTGRILPTETVESVGVMTEVMKDLCPTTFCVPMMYKHSPLAFSLVNEVHWYSSSTNHSGIETVWRYVLKEAFIISGREVVKKIKVSCERCRFLRKKTIELEMGPVSNHNLNIAPAFYV